MKEQYLKPLTNIPFQNKPRIQVKNKPIKPLLIVLALGIILQITLDWRWMILGVLCIISTAYLLLRTSDYKVVDIYDEGFIVYQINNNTEAYILKWDDVLEWRSNFGAASADYFIIQIPEDFIKFTTFNSKAVSKYFWKYMPEKEGRNKMLEQMKTKKEPLNWGRWFKNMFR